MSQLATKPVNIVKHGQWATKPVSQSNTWPVNHCNTMPVSYEASESL